MGSVGGDFFRYSLKYSLNWHIDFHCFMQMKLKLTSCCHLLKIRAIGCKVKKGKSLELFAARFQLAK